MQTIAAIFNQNDTWIGSIDQCTDLFRLFIKRLFDITLQEFMKSNVPDEL
jgi:hypothetical protein